MAGPGFINFYLAPEYFAGGVGEILNKKEQDEIYSQISEFVGSQQFENLFSGKIKCEVPLVGYAENQMINARIDLLVIKENEIIIIDYKSDESLPDKLPQQYVKQLNIYKKLMTNIYPDKKISCGIFWVGFLKFEMV